ncbi:PREDICTED: transmembrane protein 135-like [Nicrophorus vespilloides]|uniref:Transmembrane protein 135-like n=1 Tax=Nicrophorus vespilloides TaxID=110193 RepID=A0ABM1MSP6_NICVS|nr:PREDICTED: transmembrane protein 135-like [Nicrophorus vespilloides]
MVLSKLAPIGVSCQEYVHPWTSSCSQATCGLYLWALGDALRVYSTVYILALVMKGKIPTLDELKKTIKGILQSTAFLSVNAFGYSGFLCILRAVLGHFNVYTVSGLPAFLASIFAILIERPSRRLMLALYVSNVATETVWNMLLYRNMVKSVKNGQVAIFAGSMAILLAVFKAGLHKKDGKSDSMFNIFKFVLGPYEEKDYNVRSSQSNNICRQDDQNGDASSNNGRWPTNNTNNNRKKGNAIYGLIVQALKIYKRTVHRIKCCDRHSLCPHPFSCIYYTVQGSAKMFSVGLGLQLALKVVLNLKTIFRSPQKLGDIVFQRKNLNIAAFLGGASGLFRMTMCALRRITGKDDAIHALPAGLIAGLAFFKYPDTTIALYVFWKMLQIMYNLGIDMGFLPKIPGFTNFLYCLSTAILFHAAIVEPTNLRGSYWKFLHSMSGGRIAVMDRKAMDIWGLDTSESLLKVLGKTKTKAALSWHLVQ